MVISQLKIANRIQERLYRNIADIGNKINIPIRIGILLCDQGYENIDVLLSDAKYAQVLASAQGDEYSKYYYQFSTKKKSARDKQASERNYSEGNETIQYLRKP